MLRRIGRPPGLAGERAEQAVAMHAAGASLRAVARELGVGREAVRTALSAAGVDLAAVQRVAEMAADRSGMSEYQASSESGPVADVDGGNGRNQAGWPPPVEDSTVWLTAPRGFDGSVAPVQVRRVQLAGHWRYVDAAGRLWCDDCRGLFGIDQVLRMTYGEHRVALPNRGLALVRPLDDADHDRLWGEPMFARYMGAW